MSHKRKPKANGRLAAKIDGPPSFQRSKQPGSANCTVHTGASKCRVNSQEKLAGIKGIDNQARGDKFSSSRGDHGTVSKRKAADQPSTRSNGTVARKRQRTARQQVILNHPPTERLSVYVFGSNEHGELGLGSSISAEDGHRPCLNPNLPPKTMGVVQVTTGGMHCAALTHDNRIVTWGVNDLGALGRDTQWDGGMVEMKDRETDGHEGDVSSNGSDAMNPREATPTPIPYDAFPEYTVFTYLAAADSATFALTNDGLVYGWGCFRGLDDVLGFSPSTKHQWHPTLVPGLRDVTCIRAGDNHVLALTAAGDVFAWGAGEQSQLGRKLLERRKLHGLAPSKVGLPKRKRRDGGDGDGGIVSLGTGANHSFAVHQDGRVFAWGNNSYGQTGNVPFNQRREESLRPPVLQPAVVESLSPATGNGKVQLICGGNAHSIAVTDQGKCLAWGRLDNFSCGHKLDGALRSSGNVILDFRGRPRILTSAMPIPGLEHIVSADAGGEHSLAISRNGEAFAWGFNVYGQTGQGATDEVETPILVDTSATRGKKMVGAGGGGSYSVLLASISDRSTSNGDS